MTSIFMIKAERRLHFGDLPLWWQWHQVSWWNKAILVIYFRIRIYPVEKRSDVLWRFPWYAQSVCVMNSLITITVAFIIFYLESSCILSFSCIGCIVLFIPSLLCRWFLLFGWLVPWLLLWLWWWLLLPWYVGWSSKDHRVNMLILKHGMITKANKRKPTPTHVCIHWCPTKNASIILYI